MELKDSKKAFRIHIEPNQNFTEEIKYVFTIFSKHRKIPLIFTDPTDADFQIMRNGRCDIPTAFWFYDELSKRSYDHSGYFDKECIVKDENGENDYVATAFYMINCIQEYSSSLKDEVGRYSYDQSYQNKFGNAGLNLVERYFDRIAEHPFKIINPAKPTSKILLTHDIDTVYGAWLQDGFHLLKKLNIIDIFPLLIHQLLNRPDWLNMDKIMKIESEYDFKSVFLWLVNKGRVTNKIENSDYSFHSRIIQNQITRISQNGFENGIHKSISNDSFTDEISRLKFAPIINRNHYLKISLPTHYEELDNAGIKLDTTLGFAEHYGFRNSYGLPFNPFNLAERKPFNVVEVPLNIMDGTFIKYQKLSIRESETAIINFLDENKFNCILTILWHNTSFTNYKYSGYLPLYKKILGYLYESGFKTITASEIVTNYSVHQS